MDDGVALLMIIAGTGIVLAIVLRAIGFARGDPLAGRMQAFAKLPGETSSQHSARVVRLGFLAILTAICVMAFACAVINWFPISNAPIGSLRIRIIVGAAGLVIGGFTVVCAGTRDPNWPRK